MDSQSEMDEIDDVAAALRVSLGLLRRQLQLVGEGDMTLPQVAALTLLEREGHATVTDLARAEQISTQSVGATVKELERRGFIERSPDPHDGRRVFISVTEAGLRAVRARRLAKSEYLTRAIGEEFSAAERKQVLSVMPLLDRLTRRIGKSAT
jgi:DNA-binding MarR family transcriptional regulator